MPAAQGRGYSMSLVKPLYEAGPVRLGFRRRLAQLRDWPLFTKMLLELTL